MGTERVEDIARNIENYHAKREVAIGQRKLGEVSLEKTSEEISGTYKIGTGISISFRPKELPEPIYLFLAPSPIRMRKKAYGKFEEEKNPTRSWMEPETSFLEGVKTYPRAYIDNSELSINFAVPDRPVEKMQLKDEELIVPRLLSKRAEAETSEFYIEGIPGDTIDYFFDYLNGSNLSEQDKLLLGLIVMRNASIVLKKFHNTNLLHGDPNNSWNFIVDERNFTVKIIDLHKSEEALETQKAEETMGTSPIMLFATLAMESGFVEYGKDIIKAAEYLQSQGVNLSQLQTKTPSLVLEIVAAIKQLENIPENTKVVEYRYSIIKPTYDILLQRFAEAVPSQDISTFEETYEITVRESANVTEDTDRQEVWKTFVQDNRFRAEILRRNHPEIETAIKAIDRQNAKRVQKAADEIELETTKFDAEVISGITSYHPQYKPFIQGGIANLMDTINAKIQELLQQRGFESEEVYTEGMEGIYRYAKVDYLLREAFKKHALPYPYGKVELTRILDEIEIMLYEDKNTPPVEIPDNLSV